MWESRTPWTWTRPSNTSLAPLWPLPYSKTVALSSVTGKNRLPNRPQITANNSTRTRRPRQIQGSCNREKPLQWQSRIVRLDLTIMRHRFQLMRLFPVITNKWNRLTDKILSPNQTNCNNLPTPSTTSYSQTGKWALTGTPWFPKKTGCGTLWVNSGSFSRPVHPSNLQKGWKLSRVGSIQGKLSYSQGWVQLRRKFCINSRCHHPIILSKLRT